MMAATYSIADVADRMGAPSVRWVLDQIRAGRFPARKIGRSWRMTDEDVADALDACRNSVRQRSDTSEALAGLTPASKRRLFA